MAKTKHFYATTPIYYVNERPHLGHLFTSIIADVVTRLRRLRGEDAFLLSGSDEHAHKVVTTAQENGVTTQEWADRNAALFQQAPARFGV
ncbi:MAG: class I tRNA ligase family protein, partial [Myxococcota bacterium]